ncbi:hypothetical protein HBA54_12860 [Pelagibius litoralis]|uniref:Flagellar assembly protein FliH n=1 Tax=Pelagibius litoralis TaxID=374515 RepID=A0A967EXZ6_9PROT|nr:FliH/SctL family protein [Pelagibius litoralis]NIA69484.1 hypothetical protein [Pelagibius litoralis]
MDTYEKFLFQTSFEVAALASAAEAKAAEEVAAEELPAPTFSEEELAAAKQSAFAEGKAAGLTEAEAGIARQTEERLAALTERFESLAGIIDEKISENHQESLLAAMTVVRKLFPQLSNSERLMEAQAVVEDCLERLREEPRMVVRAADQDLDSLKDHIDTCIARSGFNGKLVFLADNRLSPGDIRVEWADGGAERDQNAIWQEIDGIIARTLGAAKEQDGKSPPTAGADGTEQKDTSQPAPPAGTEPLRRAETA